MKTTLLIADTNPNAVFLLLLERWSTLYWVFGCAICLQLDIHNALHKVQVKGRNSLSPIISFFNLSLNFIINILYNLFLLNTCLPILLSHAPSGFYVEGDNTTLPCLSSEFCQPTRKQAAERHVYSVAFL